MHRAHHSQDDEAAKENCINTTRNEPLKNHDSSVSSNLTMSLQSFQLSRSSSSFGSSIDIGDISLATKILNEKLDKMYIEPEEDSISFGLLSKDAQDLLDKMLLDLGDMSNTTPLNLSDSSQDFSEAFIASAHDSIRITKKRRQLQLQDTVENDEPTGKDEEQAAETRASFPVSQNDRSVIAKSA